MKSPSTLRQSGGADIKLKDRTKQILKLLLILLITAGVCYLVYFQVDYLMNGSFVDWFETNFTTMYNTYDADFGGEYVRKEIEDMCTNEEITKEERDWLIKRMNKIEEIYRVFAMHCQCSAKHAISMAIYFKLEEKRSH